MRDASSHWVSLREQCCSSRNSTGFSLTDRLEIGSWQKVIYPVQNYRWEGIQGQEAEKRWLSTQGSLGYKEGAAFEEAGVQKLGWKQSPTTWRYQLATVNLSSLVANVSYLIENPIFESCSGILLLWPTYDLWHWDLPAVLYQVLYWTPSKIYSNLLYYLHLCGVCVDVYARTSLHISPLGFLLGTLVPRVDTDLSLLPTIWLSFDTPAA